MSYPSCGIVLLFSSLQSKYTTVPLTSLISMLHLACHSFPAPHSLYYILSNICTNESVDGFMDPKIGSGEC